MKKKEFPLRICAAVVTLNLASVAHAELSSDGYFRVGTGAGTNNNSSACFALAGDGLKYRLGNECDIDLEFNLKNTIKVDALEFSANFMPYLYSTSQDAVNANLQVAQGFITAKGFDILPEANFWVGKRYYGRSDIYITDTKYTNLDGTGGGVDNIDVRIGKLGVAYFRRETSKFAGWSTASRVNVELSTNKVNPGGWLRALLGFVNSEEERGHNGLSLTLQHNQNNLFGAGGSNTVWIQYAQGSAGLNGNFAKAFNNPNDGNDYVPTDLSSTTWVEDASNLKSYRIADAFTWQAGNFGGMLSAHIQNDHYKGYKTSSNTLGSRASYAFTKNFKLVGEAGISNRKPTGGSNQQMIKFTIAPTLSVGRGFWDKPELRLFYTYATWNDAASQDGANTGLAGRRTGRRYGVQMEYWW